MAEGAERSLGQEINTWVQTIGILVAAGWGIYTFVYKEIVLPKGAPVNISVNLQLKKIGPAKAAEADPKKQLVAVEMRVSATNPSPREVYLLPSAWVAYGDVDNMSDSDLVAADVEQVINSHKGQYLQKHANIAKAPILAAGSLFSDTSLKPGETTMSTVIIYVPAGTYDRIEVDATMPTANKEHAVALEWKMSDSGLDPVVYRLDSHNERTEMEKDANGGYSDPEIGLQMATSSSQVSLWQ